MSLIIATGSNLGDSIAHLTKARDLLMSEFSLLAKSKIYRSPAVDYESQPDFFNQVLEFEIPQSTPERVMARLLEIEASMGRKRDVWRGPRTIDLDIIFWSAICIKTESVTIPHPRWLERSFVVQPLKELPFFQTIEKCFTIPESFNVEASPI